MEGPLYVWVRLAVHVSQRLTRRVFRLTERSSRASAVGFWIMIGLAPFGIVMALAGVAIGGRNATLGGIVLLSGLGAVVLGLMLIFFGPLAGDVDL